MRWAFGLAPYIGSLMLTIGLVQTGAALTAVEVKMRFVGTGLMIAGGGVLLIAKKTGGSLRLARYVLASSALAAAILFGMKAG